MALGSSSSIELATAYVSLSTSAKGLRGEIDKAVGGAVDATGKKQGSRLGGLLWGGVKTAGVAAAGGIAAVTGAALFKGFGRLSGIEDAEAKLRGLGHSAETVSGVMDNALASVKGTAFGLDEAATTAAGAVAAGIKPGRELERTLGLTADTATIAGSSMGEMGSIFNKVATGNRLTMQEVNQLGDRGIPIMQMLADQYGVTAIEARKMVERGEVDFADFQSAIEDNIAGAALESGNTTSGAFKNMGAALGRVGAQLLGGIFPKLKGGFGGITDFLDRMGPTAEKVGTAIGNAIQWIADKVGDFVTEFKAGEGAGGQFRESMTRVRDALVAAFSYVRDEVLPRLIELWGWVRDNKDLILSLAAGLGVAFAALKSFMFIKNVTIAVKAFSAALMANPIGLVVAAIGALIGGLIYLYNTNEDARRIMNAAWEKIKSVISAVASWAIDTAWPWMQSAFQWIGEKATWLWQNAIKPAWDKIWDIVKSVISWVKDTGWPWMRNALQEIGDKATWLWEKVITPAFEGIKSAISGAWDGAKTIFEKFKDGLDSLRNKFRSVRDGIQNIWGTVIRAIGTPVNAVVRFINSFLNGLQKAINLIPGVNFTGTWGSIPEIPLPTVPVAGAGGGGGGGAVFLADGSWVPGHSPHGRADNIPAMLTADEFVTRQWAARRMRSRHPGALEYINRFGRLPGYADGGTVDGKKRGTDDVSFGRLLWDFIRDPAKAVAGLFDKLLSGIGDSWPAQMATGMIKGTASSLAKWIKEWIFGSEKDGSGLLGDMGLGYRAMTAIIQAAVPGARISSDYRPGAVTASGFPSYHGKGRAIDIVGPMGKVFSYLRENWWKSAAELYYSPAGWLQIRHGRPHFPTGITRANHWDHVHWAMAQGGRVPKPLLFDRGGVLPTGTSLVHNATGAPEPLMRADQEMYISSGWLQVSEDGLVRLVDARITSAEDDRRYFDRADRAVAGRSF